MIDQNEYDLAQVQIPDLDSMIVTGKQMLEENPNDTSIVYIAFYKQELSLFQGDFEPVPPQRIFFAVANNLNLQERYFNVSSIFHVYNAINATSGIIITFSKYGENDALIATVISHEYAYVFIYPYEKNDDKIQWLDDLTESSHVDDFEFDSNGTDIISMYYYYSHLNHAPYSLSHIYSYLSAQNIPFEVEPNTSADVPYVDFSEYIELLIS